MRDLIVVVIVLAVGFVSGLGVGVVVTDDFWRNALRPQRDARLLGGASRFRPPTHIRLVRPGDDVRWPEGS